MKAIELTAQSNNSYVIQKAYEIDAASLRNKYSFLKNAKIIFSDSLFNAYSVDGRMSISNADASLKCRLDQYNNTANRFFNYWTSGNEVDTIAYSIPLAKLSVTKRVYTNEGIVYLLDNANNCVIVFDLLQNKALDTVYLTNQSKQDAYTYFSVNDSNAYSYYNTNMQHAIQDSLCMIQDIDLKNDTLYVSASNYFFYTDAVDTSRRFLAHFQSIALFNTDGYIRTYVPVNIQQRFLDTSRLYGTEPANIMVNDSVIYSALSTSSKAEEKGLHYIVGGFDKRNGILKPMVVLDSTEIKSSHFTNPLYDQQFCMVTKCPDIFDLAKGQRIQLPIYKQEGYERMGIADYPKFINYEFRSSKDCFDVLYSNTLDNNIYFAKVTKGKHEVVYNKMVPGMDIGYVRKLDPFNSNYVVCYFDNYKIIRVKVL